MDGPLDYVQPLECPAEATITTKLTHKPKHQVAIEPPCCDLCYCVSVGSFGIFMCLNLCAAPNLQFIPPPHTSRAPRSQSEQTYTMPRDARGQCAHW